MAFAATTHGDRAVAQHATITWLRAARQGEVLTAEAIERNRSSRFGLYYVRVTGCGGEPVAEFRGHTRLSGGRFFPNQGS
jgi:acyl-CoA thioesterase